MVLLDANAAANLAALVVVGAGLILAAVHVVWMQRSRRHQLALEAVRIMQNDAMARAVQSVLRLPDGITVAQLAVHGPEVEASVQIVEYNLDTLGWMVHRRMIPLHDLDDLMGGAVRAVWRRVHVLAEERRHLRGQETDFEWTQWLAERLEAHPSPAKQVGAHNYYRPFRP